MKVLGTTLGDTDRLSMSAYDGTEMRSTYVAVDGKFEVLLLVASLVSLDGINFGFIEGTEL